MQHDRAKARSIAIAATDQSSTMPGHLVVLAALLAAAILLASLATHAHALSFFGGPKTVKAHGGVVTVPVSEVADGKAHFYTYNAGGKDVQFFVIKSRDGVIRTALNACDVCFREKKGYTQDGDYLVCNNCGQRFHSTKVMEVKGGCNPSPLPRSLDAKNVIIRQADLQAGVAYF